jgi:hypothetical protein
MSATCEDMFDKLEIMSVLSLDPTATAVEIHEGVPIPSVKPTLPVAITVTTPALRKLSMLGFWGTVSHVPVKYPPPRLMFTGTSLTLSAGVRMRSKWGCKNNRPTIFRSRELFDHLVSANEN